MLIATSICLWVVILSPPSTPMAEGASFTVNLPPIRKGPCSGAAAGRRSRAAGGGRPEKGGGWAALHNEVRDGGRQAWRVRPHHWTQASGTTRSRRSQPEERWPPSQTSAQPTVCPAQFESSSRALGRKVGQVLCGRLEAKT